MHDDISSQPHQASLKHVSPYLLTIITVMAIQALVLATIGRDWTCTCGTIRFWQGTLDPVENSQQVSDPYSLLHMIFGFGLFLWLRWIRPSWPLGLRAVIAVFSSAVWEVMENLPFMVSRFGAEGSDYHYIGDSIINSLSDTTFVLLAFLLASRLPAPVMLGLALALEVAVYLMIGDSLAIGTVRLIAG
jgi:hypothetical protein